MNIGDSKLLLRNQICPLDSNCNESSEKSITLLQHYETQEVSQHPMSMDPFAMYCTLQCRRQDNIEPGRLEFPFKLNLLANELRHVVENTEFCV